MMPAHCHKMIAQVAKEAAHEHYEVLMGSNNEFYAKWKENNPDVSPKELERRFVNKNWGNYLQFARATLAKMLTGPLPDHLKDEIVDALSKDQSLRRNRRTGYQQLLN